MSNSADFSVLSSLLNVGLDLFFIRIFHMGVKGPALATVISQLFSGTLCLCHIRKHYENLHVDQREWKLLGSISVAAVTAAGRINQLLCTPVDALASTMSTYAGQNMGAGKPERHL